MPYLNLVKGDTIEGVEYRDSLPTNMIGIPKPVFDAAGFMFQWYGLESFADGVGFDRGAIWVSRTGLTGHYRVSGNQLIKVSENNVEQLGAIPGSDNVSMAYSFNNLAIVADGRLYYYNPTAGLREITGENVGNPLDVVWIDGYFVLTDGEYIYHSSILDEEVYLPLDFTNPEFRPDPSKGLAINEDNELVVFGQFTTEYYTNTGNDNFAFTRITRKAQKIGIIGTQARKELNGKWYTLARRKETSPSFHIISLGAEQKFSTREVDKILATYDETELEVTTIDTMVIDDIKLVQFNLTRHTLIFNESMADRIGIDNAWSILKSDVKGDTPFRGRGAIFDPDASKWVVGDRVGGNIGFLSDNVTHYGEIAEWILDTPFVYLNSLSVDKIEIETIPGVAPDQDATVAFSTTYDGRAYSKEYWELYGENNDFNQRFYLRRCGYVRHFVGFRLRGASRSRMTFASFEYEAS